MLRLIFISLFVLTLAACSGGSGESVQQNPDLEVDSASGRSLVLNGPPPETDDVQRFRVNLWENIAPENRCGQCHGVAGQSPTFARNDNINLAYEQANPIVNLNQPSQSRMVVKVAQGHNCWLASDQACEDILTIWVSNWAGESAGNSNQIQLQAPVLRDPGASKSFPTDSASFAANIHPLLTTYCADCHVDSAPIPQSPFFAVADADAAYAAARNKIELDEPSNSRLVLRLGAEFHNCWTDCLANATEMQAAIQVFVDSIDETAVDPLVIASKALSLNDGIVASGGGRYDTNVIALYQFKTLTGTTAFDTSGVDPALNLNFSGNVEWVGGWGIRMGEDGKAQASTGSSRKLFDLITSTGEYSIEAWITPGNVTQQDARIVGYSAGNNARNFSLLQTLYNYDFLARSSVTTGNGDPALSTPDADEVLQATLQHVVVTFDPTLGRQIYVDGVRIDVADDSGGSLNDWDDTFAFVLGNEVSGDRLWRGVLKLVAIHNRALTPVQIRQNFDVGVGEQFFMLFGVSHLIDVPDAFIVFEFSQFDNFSYLFNQPYFLSLDENASPVNIPIKGMTIGINGREPEVGQAYRNLDMILDESNYSQQDGQLLSAIGTILGIEKGSASDEFFLAFEQIGDNTNVVSEPALDATALPIDGSPEPDIGIKTFDEINASLSQITGVAMSQNDVFGTFSTIRQQLPGVASIEGFLSSQQMAVTQLAIEYCSALVDDVDLRSALFPQFNFTVSPVLAFDTTGRDALFEPLIDAAFGINLVSQPDRVLTRNELESLVTALSSSPGDEQRTEIIVKAACAATLGSAVILIQ